jgi:hypothetical protein
MIGFIICMVVLFLLINFGVTLYIISEREYRKDKDGRNDNLH